MMPSYLLLLLAVAVLIASAAFLISNYKLLNPGTAVLSYDKAGNVVGVHDYRNDNGLLINPFRKSRFQEVDLEYPKQVRLVQLGDFSAYVTFSYHIDSSLESLNMTYGVNSVPLHDTVKGIINIVLAPMLESQSQSSQFDDDVILSSNQLNELKARFLDKGLILSDGIKIQTVPASEPVKGHINITNNKEGSNV